MPVDPNYPENSSFKNSTSSDAQDQFAGPYASSSSWHSSPLSPQRPLAQRNAFEWIGILSAIMIAVLHLCISFYPAFFSHRHSDIPDWQHDGEVARLDQLHGSGRIYLLQLGPHTDAYSVGDLAEWLRDKYSLDTQILLPTALDSSAWDSSRHRYIAERLYAQIKREHPVLAADPNAWLIGFTDAEMYSATEKWSSTFSQRDGYHTAIISSSGIQDSPSLWRRLTTSHKTSTSELQNRIRRILLKDVAVLFWHLPLNNDPGSLLYFSLNPSIPTNDVYQTDLGPTHSPWGEFIADPCIVFIYTAQTGLKSSAGDFIRPCEHPEAPDEEQAEIDAPNSLPNIAQERIELRLRYGLLTEKHTDFYLPGPVPIRFERATNNRWLMPQAFGISGSHNYDRYLTSNDKMRHIKIVNAGSGDISLVRTPAWLSLLAFNKWIDSDASGSNLALRWRTAPMPHFDLRRFNGEVESYMPCVDSEFCYLNGYRSSNGGVLTMQRDSDRRLTSLSATGGNWLHLSYDSQPRTRNRITEIVDSRGRRLLYQYNSMGQLASVTYPSGEVLSYTYDKQQNLLSLSVAPNASVPPVVLITNYFQNGRIIRQVLADGSVYTYDYLPVGDGEASTAAVRTPDGTRYEVTFGDNGAVIRQ